MQPLTKRFLQVPGSHNSVLSLSQQGLQPACAGVAAGDAAHQDKDTAVTPVSQFWATNPIPVLGLWTNWLLLPCLQNQSIPGPVAPWCSQGHL